MEYFFKSNRITVLPIALPLATLGLMINKADNLTIIARKKTIERVL